ncbi:hypothetical protein [uncultured Parabacteroides sp.]|uniref:hypothetical protein n=1 Tax=uncultured Parabacteroides sp. TaxID=512312 RepID=UPI0026DBF4D6|nr:hypothetical protein [uncultured Parabacteroides sp.]
MSLFKRYISRFFDKDQVKYDIELWQEADQAFAVEEIVLIREAVVIEWPDKDKLDPIRSSAVTLQLISESDRKFTDLYAVAIKSVRLNIYRNEAIYWSGTIDTELYEEPYYTPKGYVVSLTFSDFAVLDRIKWTETGFKTINQVIDLCINSMGIKYNSIVKHLSTQLSSYDTSDIFESLSLISDNFYNEDGEADTLKHVLEYILTPFTAHIQQKNGQIHIYDINQIAKEEPRQIKWVRRDSVLGVDKVYNNAKVTFSAYEKTDILSAEMNEDDFEIQDPDSGILVSVDRSKQADGFRVKLDETKDRVFEIYPNTGAKYFCIIPKYSGDESRGIAYCCTPDNIQYLNKATSCMVNGKHGKGELFRVRQQPYLGYVSYRRMDYRLKLTLDFLFDVRYNPFEQSGRNNEEGNWENLTDWCNFAYVPIMLTIRDETGKALYHYKNSNLMEVNGYSGNGNWVAGEAAWGDCYLAYYDVGNRKSASGLGGWSTNRQIIGYYRDELPQRITKRGEGEYIELPSCAGWLDVRVGVGIYQFDYKREEKDIYSRTRWVMYKSFNIELVDKYGNALSLKDQIHNAWIEKNAEEEYEIETHIGTMKKPSPVARGVLFKTGSNDMVSELYRNEYVAGLEQLAIGTMYSQFGSRKNKLSGTVKLLPDFSVCSDNNTIGKFMLTSEFQNLNAATSEINMIEIESDDYEGVEFK